MSKQNPFKNLILDREEQEINEAVETGKVKPVLLSAREKRRLQKIAEHTLNKTRNINIRLSERTLLKLKAKAAVEGIPYQTLAGSIIHKYTAA